MSYFGCEGSAGKQPIKEVHRLNVISIRVPPLRERREDIGRLADKLINQSVSSPSMPLRANGTGETIWDARQSGKQHLENWERERIIELLQVFNGNISRVAKEMGISRTTLYKKMLKYKVEG